MSSEECYEVPEMTCAEIQKQSEMYELNQKQLSTLTWRGENTVTRRGLIILHLERSHNTVTCRGLTILLLEAGLQHANLRPGNVQAAAEVL